MKVRIPFIPLSFSQEFNSIPGELMVDYQNNLLYIRNQSEVSVQLPNKESIISYIDSFKNTLLDGVDPDHNTIRRLELSLNDLEEWFRYHSGDTDTISSALEAFDDYDFSKGKLVYLLNNKVDMQTGKGLSNNNFTINEKNKIMNLPNNANNYMHPRHKVCNYTPPVSSINGKIGNNVIITKFDIEGLGDVHPFANNYTHPPYQVCQYDFPVKSLDGKTGNVIVTKDDAELGEVENYPIAENYMEVGDTSKIRYVTLKTLNDYIRHRLYGDSEKLDGRVAVTINIQPSYCNAVFKLRRIPDNDFEIVGWTYGRTFRLYPGHYEWQIDSNVDWKGKSGRFEVRE